MTVDTSQFRFAAGGALQQYPTSVRNLKGAQAQVAKSVARLSDLQELLWADNRQSVLLIFQGMDTAGKDGTIKRVTSGVDPAGFQVFSFRQPTHEELDHNYLWRYWRAMPERGRIGIFNRSYYEEVLVVRVHPEMIEQRPLPHERLDEDIWQQRLEDIASMERHLWRDGTLILKFYLHLSKDEQKSRLLARLTNRDKLWKFDPRDLQERQLWDAYQQAYQHAIEATHDDHAPWFVIPADDKWTMRAIVAQILTEEIARLQLRYPVPATGDGWVEDAIAHLEGEDG
ncbi:MAG: PPK2 family polyphosphate kinase [Pseudomonadales bacterium]